MADVRSWLDPADRKYLKEELDPGFSPERNQAVINETIQETVNFFNNIFKENSDDLNNRIDILSSYAIKTMDKGHTMSLKQYLGPEQYKAIVGEKTLSKVRVANTINTLSNIKQKGIIL